MKTQEARLINLTRTIECPHIEENNTKSVYRTFTIGNMWIWLCRACWGELVVEVRDWLAEVKVVVK